MSHLDPLAVLDLIERALISDEGSSPEIADQFLRIFDVRDQLSLLGHALRVTASLDKEHLPCLPITAPSPIG
jgi:hypothetical protein